MKILLISILVFSATAFANVQKNYEACIDKATNTAEQMQCIADEYEYQDLQLNTVYKALINKIKKSQSEEKEEILVRVQNAQKSWIPFRDASCDVDSIVMLGGTGEKVLSFSCQARMTKERVEALKNIDQDVSERL